MLLLRTYRFGDSTIVVQRSTVDPGTLEREDEGLGCSSAKTWSYKQNPSVSLYARCVKGQRRYDGVANP